MIRTSDIHVVEGFGLEGVYWTRHSKSCWTASLTDGSGKDIMIVDNEVLIKDEDGNVWKLVIITFNGKLKAVMKNDVCFNELMNEMEKYPDIPLEEGFVPSWRTKWSVLNMLVGFEENNGRISVNLDPKYFGLIHAGETLKEYPAWEDDDGWLHEWGLIAS